MQPIPGPESDNDRLRFEAQLLNAVEQAILTVDLTGLHSPGLPGMRARSAWAAPLTFGACRATA